MFIVQIQGLGDGTFEVSEKANASEIVGLFPEFCGAIEFNGSVTKLGKRFTIKGTAIADATFICDYSTEQFQEKVKTEIEVSFVLDTELYLLRKQNPVDETYEVHVEREDAKILDITNEVIEELTVALPLKRIAPQYRDKDVHELFDKEVFDDSETKNDSDSRWDSLKNLKFNN